MNAFGILAIATILFKNRIVMSKIYHTTSIMIHLMPIMIMYVVTDIIMVAEAQLPEEQRTFCTISEKERTFSKESVLSLVLSGLTVYTTWAVCYYIFLFPIGQNCFKFK